jgi:hypothetical protein
MELLTERAFSEKLHEFTSQSPNNGYRFDEESSLMRGFTRANPLSNLFQTFAENPRSTNQAMCNWILKHLNLLKLHHLSDLIKLREQWERQIEYKSALFVKLLTIIITKFQTDGKDFEEKLELSSDFFSESAKIKTKEYHASQIEFILANDPVARFGFSPQRCVELAMRYKDLLSVNISVCSYLKDIECQKLTKICTSLESLTLSHYETLQDKSLENISELHHLRYLRFGGCPEITNLGIKELSRLQNLETLELHHLDNVDDQGIKPLFSIPSLSDLSLECLPKLERLDIDSENNHLIKLSLLNTGMHGAGLKKLVNLTKLKNLSLAASKKISDESITDLLPIKTLETLDLTNCPKLTDAASIVLSQLPNLTGLKLGWSKISDDFLKNISQMKLKHLNIKGCENIESKGFSYLRHLHNLISLDLQWTNVDKQALQEITLENEIKHLQLDNCPKIDNDTLRSIKHKEPLEYLSLTGNSFFDEDTFEIIMEMKQLKQLLLADCAKIDDAGIQKLTALKHLQAINLQGCNEITDAGIKTLSEMTALRSIDLTYCTKITDEGIRHLTKLPHLKTLKLNWTRITDKGLMYLGEAVHLNALDLSYCENITDTGLIHLGNLAFLESLNIMNCPQITIAGKKYLFSVLTLESLQRNFVFSPLQT